MTEFSLRSRMYLFPEVYCSNAMTNSVRQLNQWAMEDQAGRDVIRVANDVAICYLLISMAKFANSFQKE